MRNALLAIAAVAAALAFGGGSASARDYRFCLQQGWEPGPGTCYYDTYAQCMASASGRNAYCQENPKFAFARQYGYQRGYRGGYVPY